MKDSGSHEGVTPVPRHPLWIWSRIAVALGLLSPLLLLSMGHLGHRHYDFLDWSIYVALAGWAASLGCLSLAAASAEKHTRQSLEGMAGVLPIPFVTSLPALYTKSLVDSWGSGGLTGILLIVSMILFPVVLIAGAVVVRRGSTP